MFSLKRARHILLLLLIIPIAIILIHLIVLNLREPTGYDPKAKPKPLYRPPPQKPPLIVDNFPLAAKAKSASDLPSVPSWNKPPGRHVKQKTPLFIGFTRNWRLLQQTVVSYIVAGWPAGDIHVIENTGVMNSNRDGLLTLQNPFYLDYHRLTKIFGVKVLRTPTLLTFAQLQNFYLSTAIDQGWEHYWWAHMDTVAVSDEEYEAQPYKSLYTRAVEEFEKTLDPAWGQLATLWFAYDRLALVRTQAFVDVGGWDTMIPFYMTDCDMHERLWMKEFRLEAVTAGKVWDVAESLDDLHMLYQRGEVGGKQRREVEVATQEQVLDKREDGQVQKNSPAYKELLVKLEELQNAKSGNEEGRNTWQARQKGGQGEPFYRDPDGFEKALRMWMDFGRDVFAEKWGRRPCNIRDAGLKDGDEWRVVADWENEDVQRKYWKDKEREAKERGREG
ncbi:MAG: hypothetical protein Q9163_005068 [Psora crenata]